MVTPSSYEYLGIRKSEFVAKIQFLSLLLDQYVTGSKFPKNGLKTMPITSISEVVYLRSSHGSAA